MQIPDPTPEHLIHWAPGPSQGICIPQVLQVNSKPGNSQATLGHTPSLSNPETLQLS